MFVARITFSVLVIVFALVASQSAFAEEKKEHEPGKVIAVPLDPNPKLPKDGNKLAPLPLPKRPDAPVLTEEQKAKNAEEARVKRIAEEFRAYARFITEYNAQNTTDYKPFDKIPNPWRAALLDVTDKNLEGLDKLSREEVETRLKDSKKTAEEKAEYLRKSIEQRRAQFKEFYRTEMTALSGTMAKSNASFKQLYSIQKKFKDARDKNFEYVLSDMNNFSLDSIRKITKNALDSGVRLPNSPIEAVSQDETDQRELHATLNKVFDLKKTAELKKK